MAAGLGQLKLTPDAFWALTLRELNAALRGRVGLTVSSAPPTRHEMQDLMRSFPDT